MEEEGRLLSLLEGGKDGRSGEPHFGNPEKGGQPLSEVKSVGCRLFAQNVVPLFPSFWSLEWSTIPDHLPSRPLASTQPYRPSSVPTI